MDLLTKFRKVNRPLIINGAMGSLLEQSGLIYKDEIWSARALITNKKDILKIHKEYLYAGADIITTNTFRTNPNSLINFPTFNYKSLVKKAVDICKEAANNYDDIIIGGSNPPAEDCYRIERTIDYKRLTDNHQRHIDELFNNGVDIIWNETFSHLDEIIFVCEYCKQNKSPFVMSLYLNADYQILSGEYLDFVLNIISEYQPVAIGLNCISLNIFNSIDKNIFHKYNHGFYLNCGAEYSTSDIKCDIRLEDYKQLVLNNINKRLVFIGSCCGSNPSFTMKIKETLNEFYQH